MELTRERILAKKADCQRAGEQAQALLHMNAGALQLCDQLLKMLEQPEPAPPEVADLPGGGPAPTLEVVKSTDT